MGRDIQLEAYKLARSERWSKNGILPPYVEKLISDESKLRKELADMQRTVHKNTEILSLPYQTKQYKTDVKAATKKAAAAEIRHKVELKKAKDDQAAELVIAQASNPLGKAIPTLKLLAKKQE